MVASIHPFCFSSIFLPSSKEHLPSSVSIDLRCRAIILLESNLGFSQLEEMVLKGGRDKVR
jgi:hypothetical protein